MPIESPEARRSRNRILDQSWVTSCLHWKEFSLERDPVTTINRAGRLLAQRTHSVFHTGSITVTDGLLEQQLSFLKKLQWVGYSIIGAVLLAAHYTDFSQRIVAILSRGNDSLLALLQVLLGLFVIALITEWVVWTAYELQMCERNVSWIPPIRPRDYFIILFGGGGLGLLGYLYDRIVPFTFVFLVIDVLTLIGTRDFDQGFGLALKKVRMTEKAELEQDQFKREIIDAIQDYYEGRPQELRIVLGLCARLVALTIAIVGHLEKVNSRGLAGLLEDFPSTAIYAAYLLNLAAGLASEGVITTWRMSRDGRVRNAQIARELAHD